MPSVRLVPMSRARYAEFLDEQARDFADGKTRAGQWSEAEALDLARETLSALVPPEGPRAGHRVFDAVDAEDRLAGWVWIGPYPDAGEGDARAWLYQITVAPARRGLGYGRAILAEAERLAAREGATALHLNVFRHNRAALRLYASAGYGEVAGDASSAELAKRLTASA